MVLPLALGALGAAGGGGGAIPSVNPSSSATATAGDVDSGRNVISISPEPLNIGAIVAAVAGSETNGGVPFTNPARLSPYGQETTTINSPLSNIGGMAIPLLAIAGVGILFLAMKKRNA